MRKTWASAIGVAAAVLVLAGCAPLPATSPTATAEPFDPNALSVVATTTQVADFTREVGGSAAQVTQLIQPNQSAHSYDPSASDLVALSQADLIVENGAGLEEWLKDAIDASGSHAVVVDASTGIALDGHGAAESGEEHGSNPHIWTDPRRAAQMVNTIADALAAGYPRQASAIQDRAEAYTAKLTALDDWTRQNVDTVPAAQRLFVSNHDAFGYFVEAYGIDYVGSVIPSFDDNAEPSAAEIDRLVVDIKATGTTAVFSEASLSPKLADTIAREAGVKVYDGDDALYGDSLGPAGSDGDTYIRAQLHNVRQLLDSWGVTPTELPAELQ
ncbi:metal ABC transporter substrate-binding protein [Rathayibacter sp. YIM 133350]|uniref:metal ABC transporter substrate-binding protein n=1 Tax=Rathayibacter sp. YIM 133350 TaxID=3131992 RepID=UPI00307E8D93